MAVSHDTASQLGHELMRVAKLFGSLRQHAPRPHPAVEPSAYPILFNLLDGPRRVSALAVCVHSDVSTISRQVSHLVAHELVEKLPDPRDGRVTMLSLTPSGKELLQGLHQMRGEWFRSMIEDWEPSDAETLQMLLSRLVTSLESARETLDRRAGDTAPGIPSQRDASLPTPYAEPASVGGHRQDRPQTTRKEQ